MKILVVENNLAAFLTAVYHAYYGHKDAEKITSDAESVTMLDYGIRLKRIPRWPQRSEKA